MSSTPFKDNSVTLLYVPLLPYSSTFFIVQHSLIHLVLLMGGEKDTKQSGTLGKQMAIMSSTEEDKKSRDLGDIPN